MSNFAPYAYCGKQCFTVMALLETHNGIRIYFCNWPCADAWQAKQGETIE